ncbi:acyltransferase [Epilithonimonas sp. JDS]|uniref:acyltransferase family protein n=1 Tax=Epilithonimonas sp. JDS TaxID=2902797 RepID=UPI0021D44D09|nr:acyltransferase [Epilithonimonas sp. JDS]
MKHNNNFDFLRFLFSLLVVIGHSMILSKKPEFWNGFLASMPNYSVCAFFVISGFLVYSSFERVKNIRQYAKNRLKRILPAYFFVVIYFSIFLFFFSTADADKYFSVEWAKYLGVNFIFANFLKPCIPFVFESNPECAINGSLWTIKVELMFYLFVPFLYYTLFKKSLKTKNFILIGLYLFSFVYSLLAEKYYGYGMVKQLPGSLGYFISGILLYINLDFFQKHSSKILPAAIILSALEFYFLPFKFVFPFSLGILIIWFAFAHIPLKNFGKHGDFSYGMYLVHFPIIQLFIQEKIYDNYSYAGLFLSYIIIILCSVLIWKFIESPFLKKRKQIT